MESGIGDAKLATGLWLVGLMQWSLGSCQSAGICEISSQARPSDGQQDGPALNGADGED